jgi:hypothetical protein
MFAIPIQVKWDKKGTQWMQQVRSIMPICVSRATMAVAVSCVTEGFACVMTGRRNKVDSRTVGEVSEFGLKHRSLM